MWYSIAFVNSKIKKILWITQLLHIVCYKILDTICCGTIYGVMIFRKLLDVVSSVKYQYLYFCRLCDILATRKKRIKAKGTSEPKAQA